MTPFGNPVTVNVSVLNVIVPAERFSVPSDVKSSGSNEQPAASAEFLLGNANKRRDTSTAAHREWFRCLQTNVFVPIRAVEDILSDFMRFSLAASANAHNHNLQTDMTLPCYCRAQYNTGLYAPRSYKRHFFRNVLMPYDSFLTCGLPISIPVRPPREGSNQAPELRSRRPQTCETRHPRLPPAHRPARPSTPAATDST